MKKIIRILSIFLCSLLLTFAGCFDRYTDEELSAMEAKFASFDNNKNFALETAHDVFLIDKTIRLDELKYQDKPIDELLDLDDKCCYLATRTTAKKSESIFFSDTYTITLLRMDYDTLEMEEIGKVENIKGGGVSYSRYSDGKLYLKDRERYCVYDIATGKQEWFPWDYDEFFQDETKKYSFEIKRASNDSVVNITDNETGEIKQVSWKNDLSKFEEGRYIQQFDNRFKDTKSAFVGYTEKDGVCYLLGDIPLTTVCVDYRAVIFTYDFETEALSYYASVIYHEYNPPHLTIIER